MMPSSNSRHYARFIPREEVGDVTQWKWGNVDGSEPEPEPVAEPEVVPELPPVIDEAAQQALIQEACDNSFAQGLQEGREQAALEWQQRMDDYIAGQGQALAQRVAQVVEQLDATLAEMQQNMAQEVLALACDIARQVVRRELSVDPQAVLPVVREAVGLLVVQARPAMVRLHPQDLEAIEPALRKEYEGLSVQWLGDASVAQGGCQVESAGTVVDGSVERRWQRAVAALGLSTPWELQEHERVDSE